MRPRHGASGCNLTTRSTNHVLAAYVEARAGARTADGDALRRQMRRMGKKTKKHRFTARFCCLLYYAGTVYYTTGSDSRSAVRGVRSRCRLNPLHTVSTRPADAAGRESRACESYTFRVRRGRPDLFPSRLAPLTKYSCITDTDLDHGWSPRHIGGRSSPVQYRILRYQRHNARYRLPRMCSAL